jgi:hypothetical protein
MIPEFRAVYISPDGVSYSHTKVVTSDVALSSNTDPTFQSFNEEAESKVVLQTAMGMRVMSTEEHASLPPGTVGTIVSFDNAVIKGKPCILLASAHVVLNLHPPALPKSAGTAGTAWRGCPPTPRTTSSSTPPCPSGILSARAPTSLPTPYPRP